MKKFAIITNAYKDKELKLTHKIVDYIKEKGGYAVALSDMNPAHSQTLASQL